MLQVIFNFILTAVLITPLAVGIQFTSYYGGRYITESLGSSVNFSWTFQGADFLFIDFVFLKRLDQLNINDNDRLIAISRNGFVHVAKQAYAGRLKGIWNNQTNPGQVTFTLSSIQAHESRLFGCQIQPKSFLLNPIVDPVNLVVVEPPKISLSSMQGSYRESSFVNVSCTATGIPQPDVTWIRDGTVISSGKGAALLNINRVRKTDDGCYLCRANNTADTISNHTIILVYHPPTIQRIIMSANKSWIGQTVTLRCLSDGVPTPTLTLYKPGGRKINRVRARENKVQVTLRGNQDFGDYKCIAANGLSPSDDRIVKLTQIKKPGASSIVSSEEDIQASSLIVRWTPPADDGGSPITGYRVIIPKGDTEISSVNITDPGRTSYTLGGLDRDTKYAVKVYARNAVFEGDPVVTTMKTMLEGPPAAVGIYGPPSETTDDEITLKWKEPEDNGREITQYTAYQRLVTDEKVGEWTVVRKITKVSINELTVKLERGKVYEFTITATNELGESLVEETKVKRVTVVDLKNTNQLGDDDINNVFISDSA